MKIIPAIVCTAMACTLSACAGIAPAGHPEGLAEMPREQALDDYVETLRQRENIPGIALAIVENGRLAYTETYGYRRLDPAEPLDDATVMYGASLTKFVFAAYVMQLVEEGLIDLDRPIGQYFPQDLTAYEEWADLSGDPRWRDLTMRMLLSHTPGFANFRFFTEDGFDPDAPLIIHNDPGTLYSYSGEGYILAQRVLEEGFGIDVAADMQARLFDPLGMERTSMIWQDDFRPNFAVGYTRESANEGHNMQDNARAAGSMDTTIEDFGLFVAAFLRGDIVSPPARAEMLSPQIAITSDSQFPVLDRAVDPRNEAVALSAGLGVVLWQSPYGPAFKKGGHNEKTDNVMVCLEAGRRCVILMMNTAKGDLVFPEIVEFILQGTDFPWRWNFPGREDDPVYIRPLPR